MDGGRRALIVATDSYQHRDLNSLASATADAEQLAAVLDDEELCGFSTRLVKNAKSYEVVRAIEDILADALPADLIWMHFSCHGLKDDSGTLYLAASDTEPDRLASTAIDASTIDRMMRRSPARRVLLFLDCCYGGAFERGLIPRATTTVDPQAQFHEERLDSGRGRAIITASNAMEYSFEGPRLANGSASPSYFTSAIVEGIRTGAADLDEDGLIGLRELYDYTYTAVKKSSHKQTPSKWELALSGEIYVATTPHTPLKPGVLPSEITELVDHGSSAGKIGAVFELSRIASGEDLALALAAVETLTVLSNDDSRRVSEQARAALDQMALSVDRSDVDFGSVSPSADKVYRSVNVGGSLLAQSATVRCSDTRIAARLTGQQLRLELDPRSEGSIDAQVNLQGPMGGVALRVTGHVRRPVLQQPHPQPPAPPKSHTSSGALQVLLVILIIAVVGAVTMGIVFSFA
jgi:caspase domain-containing protein